MEPGNLEVLYEIALTGLEFKDGEGIVRFVVHEENVAARHKNIPQQLYITGRPPQSVSPALC